MDTSNGFAGPEVWRDRPAVIARPPWIVAGFLVAGFALDAVAAAPVLSEPVRYLGGAGMLVAAIGLMAAAMAVFRRTGTPVETWRATERIARDGPYGQTRNPIYVSMLIAYAGIGVLANAPAIVALAPVLFAVLHYGVVLPEEDYLECKFGGAYLDYKQVTRRWL
jgi:protein-S-isoprenylcysteine O-methyltransferase Ste14